MEDEGSSSCPAEVFLSKNTECVPAAGMIIWSWACLSTSDLYVEGIDFLSGNHHTVVPQCSQTAQTSHISARYHSQVVEYRSMVGGPTCQTMTFYVAVVMAGVKEEVVVDFRVKKTKVFHSGDWRSCPAWNQKSTLLRNLSNLSYVALHSLRNVL